MSKKLWFKAKSFGWGWRPISWQGWLILLIYILLIIPFAMNANSAHSGSDALIGFAVPFIMLTSLLLVICYKTGEKPEWRWGKKYTQTETQNQDS